MDPDSVSCAISQRADVAAFLPMAYYGQSLDPTHSFPSGYKRNRKKLAAI